MKKLLFLILCFLSFPLLAEVVAENAAVLPEWVGQIVIFLTGIPTIGPILVLVIKWVAIITAVLTVVSATVQSLSTILVASGHFLGLKKFADFIAKWSGKLLPYLKWFSAFNVKK